MSDELFPGFKVSPKDPSRDLRPPFTVALTPREMDERDYEDDDFEGAPCRNCEGWGYTDCFCGGDFCVCDYGGEKPCLTCV
jgi:hypothetical protein